MERARGAGALLLFRALPVKSALPEFWPSWANLFVIEQSRDLRDVSLPTFPIYGIAVTSGSTPREFRGKAKQMGTPSGYTRERMDSYRNGAKDATNLASPCADAELRDAYLSIAKTWEGLADKIERELCARNI